MAASQQFWVEQDQAFCQGVGVKFAQSDIETRCERLKFSVYVTNALLDEFPETRSWYFSQRWLAEAQAGLDSGYC